MVCEKKATCSSETAEMGALQTCERIQRQLGRTSVSPSGTTVKRS